MATSKKWKRIIEKSIKSDNSPVMIKENLVAECKCNKRVSSQYWQIEAPDRVTPMNITSVSPSPIQSIENYGGKYHLRISPLTTNISENCLRCDLWAHWCGCGGRCDSKLFTKTTNLAFSRSIDESYGDNDGDDDQFVLYTGACIAWHGQV